MPRVYSANGKEGHKSAREGFEIDVVVHVAVPLDIAEEYDTQDRIDIHDEHKETTYVCQALQGNDEGIEYQIQALAAALQKAQKAEDSERPQE